MLSQLAGAVFMILGMTYLAIPIRIYHFGPDFLRDAQSEPTEPANWMVWLFRFIGGCLVVMGITYLF